MLAYAETRVVCAGVGVIVSLFFFLLFLTEERKYKCHLCPYAAKCRANLNQHLTIHSVKLVNTDAEQIVSAVTAESAERKNYPYYYR